MSNSNSNRITNAYALSYAIERLSDAPAEVIEKLQKQLDQLNRKNSAPKKPTAKQTENAAFADAILAALSENPNRLWSITEMQKGVDAVAELTNQRISAIVRGLISEGKVKRVEDKRKAFFHAA